MKIIDLTHTLGEDIPVYPDTIAPEFEILNTIDKDGFAEHRIMLTSHSGTHIDAPCHILAGARSLDHFPSDKFIGDAIVIPCNDRDEIGLEFLKTYGDQIAKVDFVLFHTGWQDRWKTVRYFEDCPIFTREAALWLSGCLLKGIGFDSFSSDNIESAMEANSETLPNHHIFLSKEILLIENLANLDKLPSGIFSFQCFPLKIENSDGSPVRALAMIFE